MSDRFLLQLLVHLRAMWKYRWHGLFVAWGVAIIGAAIVLMIPRKFEASARIYANTDSILKPLMAGMTVQPDINQRVAMLSRVVISRPNVEQLVTATGLDEKVKTKEEREKLIDEIIKVLDLQKAGGRADNIYTVKFRDTRPERAKDVVNRLVSMFIDTSMGGRVSDTETAKTFLDEQAAVYEKKLQDAESRLKDFKLRHMAGVGSEEGKDFFAQMAAVKDQLGQAQLQLREAENSRDAFRRGLAGEEAPAFQPPISTAEGDNLADIDGRIDAMKRNLDGLLQKYTESHPDVVGTRRIVRELEDQRRRLVEEYRKSGTPLAQVVQTGPRASEQIKVSLAQAEASVASLRARVSEYSARHNHLREMARRMPEYEAELAQLNRDYEVNKKNYESLISRREQANISGDMQSVSGVADFRLVDPPRVDPNAVFPNRPLLLSVSLLLALLAGTATMYVAKELRPCVYDRLQLREVSGLPTLGVVSLVVSDQMKADNKKNLMRFARASAGLLGVYVLFVVLVVLATRVAALKDVSL